MVQLFPIFDEVLHCRIDGEDHGDPEGDRPEVPQPHVHQVIIEQERQDRDDLSSYFVFAHGLRRNDDPLARCDCAKAGNGEFPADDHNGDPGVHDLGPDLHKGDQGGHDQYLVRNGVQQFAHLGHLPPFSREVAVEPVSG